MKQKYTQEQVIGLKEFRLDTEKYIEEINKGNNFLVVKRSKPVFRLEPVKQEWETIGSFVDTKSSGVKAEKLLAALKKSL
jgi:antitoxin (DNA-binding transcriptional repressor) of toxin-antitoxin stability system